MWTVLLGWVVLLLSTHPLQRCDAERGPCPNGWMTYMGSCYRLLHERRTWSQAELHCRTFGARGHLASILDAEEADAVATYIKTSKIDNKGPIWIGLFYHSETLPEGRWMWMDAYKILFSLWAEGSPNVAKNGKYCVHLIENEFKHWKETQCSEEFAHLCKYEKKYLPMME